MISYRTKEGKEMGKAYGEELRERVIGAIEGGMGKSEAHRVFKVSRSTIDKWIKLKEKTGSLTAKKYRRGREAMIKDEKESHEFIKRHQDKTLKEMAKAWESERGGKISGEGMRQRLRSLGYKRKKKAIDM